jgi:hypothetical protein
MIVGLVIGIGVSAFLSIGTIVKPDQTTARIFSTVYTTAVIIYTATVRQTLTSQSSSQPQIIASPTEINIPTTSHSTTQSQSSVPGSSSTTNGTNSTALGPNVTISGTVTVNNGTSYKVTLTAQSGELYTISVLGLGDISGSVPNNETYTVVIYFYVTGGGGASSCDPQPLGVYSTTSVYSVDISC